jgi:hypothetical protein
MDACAQHLSQLYGYPTRDPPMGLVCAQGLDLSASAQSAAEAVGVLGAAVTSAAAR